MLRKILEDSMHHLKASYALSVAIALLVGTAGTALAQDLPTGSYQSSCTGAAISGARLTASCTDSSGTSVSTSIRYAVCTNTGADIANINGRLMCARNGHYYGHGRGRMYRGRGGRYAMIRAGVPPTGSYQASCRNASMNGSTLIATCTNNGGQSITSYLDISQCRSTDEIGNIDGQLRCIYRG